MDETYGDGVWGIMVDHRLLILDMLNIDESTPNENAIKRIDKYLEKNYTEIWFINPMAITKMAIDLLVVYNKLKNGTL